MGMFSRKGAETAVQAGKLGIIAGENSRMRLGGVEDVGVFRLCSR